jgi:dienelactone hydrolase
MYGRAYTVHNERTLQSAIKPPTTTSHYNRPSHSLIVYQHKRIMSCCPTTIPPVESTHQAKSDNVYIAGSGKKGLIFVPDIFGPHPNAYQVADILAGRGFLVVIPDFFHGDHWPLSDFPPKDGYSSPKFQGLLSSLEYPKLKPRVVQGIAILKALGAELIGSVGFCWGATIVSNLLADGLVSAGAACHPTYLTEELLQKATGPLWLMPSKDDGEMLELKKAAESTGHDVVYQYFDDMHHGWVAARADFSNESNRTRANEAIDVLTNFFDKHL